MFFQVFDSPSGIMLVMEYADGGELSTYVKNKGKLAEEEARQYFRQILAGVEYCHRKQIIHRDLYVWFFFRFFC